MPEERGVVSRRYRRRRRYASPWQGATAWLGLIRIQPRRASLHLLVLSAGLLAVIGTTVVARSTDGPADRSSIGAEPSAAQQAAAAELPALQPGDSAPAAAAVAPIQAAPEIRTYVVESGDTLRALAERFGVSVATIVAANKLDDPDVIAEGQELLLLPTTGTVHDISPGETLRHVASRYNVDIVQLASVNRVDPIEEQPVVGQKLVVPGIEPELKVKPKPVARATTSDDVDASDEDGQTLASLTVTGGEGEQSAKPESQKIATTRSPVTYTVQEGDSIRSLANQFGVSIQTILVANDIDDPDMITEGTELTVLPVSGVEHEVGPGESLADIAAAFKVDMGPIVDFNGLDDPDKIAIGDKLLIPGATARVVVSPPAIAEAPRASSGAPAASSPSGGSRASAAAPAAKPAVAAAAPSIVAPAVVGGGGGGIVSNAMKYLGSRYVFGGTSPSGFDCSGFVWYVHKISGIDVSRGLWGQLNGGPRISRENLQPGDTVFFANTYMPGLSHVGIYVGGGNFIHAIDERSGVGISSLGSGYWAPRYIGATRIR